MMMIKDMIDEGAQFIISAHSPIILAFKDALIYDFSSGVISENDYNDLECVKFYRTFLENPERYLRYL
jgi:predicted ATPase